MKKLLYSMLALSAVLFSACSQEDDFVAVNGEATVAFKVSAPEIATRAYSDGLSATALQYAVYDSLGNILPNLTKTDATLAGGTATVNLQLTTGNKYSVIFWAAAPDAPYSVDLDAKTMSVNYEAAKTLCNDENRDAFFKCDTFVVNGSQEKTIELRRPFAQLNVGTNDYDEAASAGYEPLYSSVTVKNVYTTLNLGNGSVDGETAVTFGYNDIEKGETFPVTGYEYLAMNYLLVPADKELVEVEFGYTEVDAAVAKTRTVGSVPVQRNYRTNIYGQLLTSDVDINVEIKHGFTDEFDQLLTEVKSSLEFEKAIRANEENIVIDLVPTATRAAANAVYELNISAWVPEYYLGGENTKTITVNGNGATINFVQHNTDWNYVRLANDDAKLILNNVNITNSNKNTGHWKRALVRFFNEVELNDVTSEKGICLMNNAELNNVDINVADENYSLWLTAQGQTVNIDGLEVVATNAGRGIKIGDEDYEDVAAKVVLNVKNAKFTTAKKAAVLVSSVAGADITLENINLSGVKADGINAVWVDEDRADHADKVTVNGGLKANEPASGVASNPFAEENATVELPAGTYTFPSEVAPGVTIKCEEGTVFSGETSLNINGATVEGATFSNPDGAAVGGTVNGSFKDCVFEGHNGLRYCYTGETTYFENCVFSGSVYGAHFDGGSKELYFKNCTFSGFNAFGSEIEKLTLDGCTFKSNGKSGYNGVNLWGTTEIINTNFVFDGSASTEWIGINAAKSVKVVSLSGCTVANNGNIFDCFANYNSGNEVTVDGKVYQMVADGLAINEDGVYEISSATGMMNFAKQVNEENKNFAGKTVKLVADVDLAGKAWIPVGQTGATQFKGTFDGNGKTISNLSIDATAQTGEFYSTGIFGWLNAAVVKNIKVVGANVKGNHNVGVIAGYLETAGCTIASCVVENATVECHHANDDACGDKAGVIVGHAGNAGVVVKDCSVANSTLSAGRDAGQVVGAAKEANVTGCSATDVTVEANDECDGSNIRNEIIGRIL